MFLHDAPIVRLLDFAATFAHYLLFFFKNKPVDTLTLQAPLKGCTNVQKKDKWNFEITFKKF